MENAAGATRKKLLAIQNVHAAARTHTHKMIEMLLLVPQENATRTRTQRQQLLRQHSPFATLKTKVLLEQKLLIQFCETCVTTAKSGASFWGCQIQ